MFVNRRHCAFCVENNKTLHLFFLLCCSENGICFKVICNSHEEFTKQLISVDRCAFHVRSVFQVRKHRRYIHTTTTKQTCWMDNVKLYANVWLFCALLARYHIHSLRVRTVSASKRLSQTAEFQFSLVSLESSWCTDEFNFADKITGAKVKFREKESAIKITVDSFSRRECESIFSIQAKEKCSKWFKNNNWNLMRRNAFVCRILISI